MISKSKTYLKYSTCYYFDIVMDEASLILLGVFWARYTGIEIMNRFCWWVFFYLNFLTRPRISFHFFLSEKAFSLKFEMWVTVALTGLIQSGAPHFFVAQSGTDINSPLKAK